MYSSLIVKMKRSTSPGAHLKIETVSGLFCYIEPCVSPRYVNSTKSEKSVSSVCLRRKTFRDKVFYVINISVIFRLQMHLADILLFFPSAYGVLSSKSL